MQQIATLLIKMYTIIMSMGPENDVVVVNEGEIILFAQTPKIAGLSWILSSSFQIGSIAAVTVVLTVVCCAYSAVAVFLTVVFWS